MSSLTVYLHNQIETGQDYRAIYRLNHNPFSDVGDSDFDAGDEEADLVEMFRED